MYLKIADTYTIVLVCYNHEPSKVIISDTEKSDLKNISSRPINATELNLVNKSVPIQENLTTKNLSGKEKKILLKNLAANRNFSQVFDSDTSSDDNSSDETSVASDTSSDASTARGSSPKNTKFSNGTYTQKNLSELLNVLT